MNQPPRSDDPSNDLPDAVEPSSSPQEPESELPDASPAGDADMPPATVLQEASSLPLRRAPYPEDSDTVKVRLVPRVPNPPPWRVIFQAFGPAPATIGLDVRQALVIGRVDPEVDEQPDLDLSPHQALEHGVSRQHAVLIPEQEALYLVDMESTNGTWVNGAYLKPGHRYPLAAGDQIELGLLRLVVKSVVPLSR